MTTASAPATSSERRDPLFQNTKNRIASLSSKNEEILDQINRLQHSHSQTLNVINSQLETFPHTDNSGQHIDSLVSNLKSRQRRSNSLQQQSISSVLKSDNLSNGKDLEDVMEVEDDYEVNETRTITTDHSLSSRKSAKLAIANRSVKELKKIENIAPNNNGGELDWKYFSAENNSDSEDGNGNASVEDKDFENVNDNNTSSSRRRISKSHPTLTINTNTRSPRRLITPESSDSEFDISNAHTPFAPSLGGGRNPLRVARHSSAEHYNSNVERHGRTANSLFSSMDGVIEEERGSLSDVAEQNEINTSENTNRMRGKQVTSVTSVNGRKRAQKYLDDYNVVNDVPKANKMHRRPQTDDSYADIPDDNSSAMSTDSFIQLEVEELRARIQKLESERIDDEIMTERKIQRRKKNYSDSMISPAALSPDSSQGGASSTTSFSRHSSVSAQHQKHLQNAFDMFEKAFTTDNPTNDSSPPPSHSMAMVVSSALSLNQKLRSVMAQMELDGQLSERGLKALLKTSDEQIRSLTECLLSLAPLAPRKVPTKKMSGDRDQLGIRGYYPNDSSILQTPTPSHSTRSVSPIPRISSAPVLAHHESQIGEHVDQSSLRRVSPIPPDQSPPNSYYASSRRYSRLSRPPSPTLPPEDSQILGSRVPDYRERKSRRSSGTAYNSYSAANPVPSSSPSPPPMQHPPTHYDQPGSRAYYEREIPRELPRLKRYSLQGYNNNLSRVTLRPSSHIRTDEPSYSLSNHARTSSTSSVSSIHRSSSGRSYSSRVAGEEYVNNSPVSATRSQPPSRLYEYTRRYPSDGQTPGDRRTTPGLEADRRYSRRIVNQYEPEDSYDGPNGYGENISERGYIRDDKAELRRSISNSSSTYKQRMVPSQEQKVNCNAEVSNEESRGENNQQDGEINHDGQNVNCSNVENGEGNVGLYDESRNL